MESIEADVDFFRSGGVGLSVLEKRILGDLEGCARVIHLQCSHGNDVFSLLNLGAHEAIGIDISNAALDVARLKNDRLGMRAQWIKADVLNIPLELSGSADLVYTGKGALPWVHDIDAWAEMVVRLLRPGGRFFLYEGHPLNWIWREQADTLSIDPNKGGYFDSKSRPNLGFPASAILRYSKGESSVTAWERSWPIGEVVSALVGVGLRLERLEECPEHFWNQFPRIPEDELRLVPRSYAVLAVSERRA
jgi:SAM-dependent methyltransferase